MAGAEELLGQGDMLFMSGDMSKPQRLQSAFISENEVKKVVGFLADAYKDELTNELSFTETNPNAIFASTIDGGSDNGSDEDDMYDEAKRVVIEAGKASTSYIQRKLRVGYSRAARLMDLLEQNGIIGPSDGSKPRSVLGAPSGESAETEGSDENTEKNI
jgi:S-DNA-T family DNA segregation ATPase FtsK/SpoIIIE